MSFPRFMPTGSAGGPPGRNFAVWDRVERRAVAHHRTRKAAQADAKRRNATDKSARM